MPFDLQSRKLSSNVVHPDSELCRLWVRFRSCMGCGHHTHHGSRSYDCPCTQKGPESFNQYVRRHILLFFHFSQIPGNLASSLILFPYGQQDDQPNASNVSSAPSEITAYLDEEAPPSDDVCNVLEVTSIDRTFYNILVSAYVFFVVTGIAILLLTVDRLQTDAHLFSAGRKFELFLKRPLLDLLKVLKDVRMIMIAPMAMFSGLEQSFVFGAFTEVSVNTPMYVQCTYSQRSTSTCRSLD